jgi:hypothetical protein
MRFGWTLGWVLAAVVTAGAADQAAPAVDLKGKLYKSVFSSGPGGLATADLAVLPEPLRGHLDRYLARRAAFRSRYKGQPDTMEEMRADAKRRALERSVVALVDAPGIEQMAADLVAAAPIAAEWNGLHRGPLQEAIHAENVLKKDPASPLASWLYVFIAERQRVAFEAYENEKDDDGMKAAARKYRTFVDRARSVDDPLIRALVDDMDRLPYLYIKSVNHPREYDPDA